jgi:hypothetical protein
MQIEGAKKLIDERGGYRAVADALKWPKTTVHTFHRNDRAPDYRWSAIEALPAPKPRKAAKKRKVAA